MTLHMDVATHRLALPLIELAGLEALVEPVCSRLDGVRASIHAGNAAVKISLHSDSAHLREFFSANWGGACDGPTFCSPATIVALCATKIPSAPQLLPGARYVNPSRTMIASVDNEYYGNVKISVRGLCSAASRKVETGGFLHGTALVRENAGFVICGASGSGKTTTTRALFELRPGEFRVVNDDWGWADHEARLLKFTGEPNLHMKYRSVRTIAPELTLSPATFPSENYSGDTEDPHARLLIPRRKVFNDAVADAAFFSGLVVIMRDASKPFFVRRLTADDVNLLEVAEYSTFYQRHERFLDGSLLLLDDADLRAERERFKRLLTQVPSVLINNVSTPADAATAVCSFVKSTTARR